MADHTRVPRMLLWIRAFLRTLFRSRQLDAELDAELQSAVAELAARYRRAGCAPEDAERRAREALGGVVRVAEDTRDVRVGIAVERLAADVGHAARALRAAPAFTLAVVATLALAIGGNTAIFSALKQLLLEPLPYRESERLVFIWSDLTAAGYPRAPLAGPELKDLRDRTTRFAGLGAIWSNTAALTGPGDPEQLRIGLVTADFFTVLGVEPAVGRHFNAADEAPGAAPSILLSWELWQRRFGGRHALVGTAIEVNGAPTTVVGVMPAGFRLWLPQDANVPEDLQAWRPFSRGILSGPRGQQYLRVIGRLRPGVEVADASAEVLGISQQIGREFSVYGQTPPAFSAVSLHDDSVRQVRQPMIAAFGGVTLLLVLACVNIANLFIARASARRDEFAVRVALGAGRGRLLQQCLAEGAVLGLLGGAAGLLAARGLLHLLVSLRPEGLNRIAPTLDAGVLGFTLVSAVGWGLLVSLAPFWTILWKEAAGSGILSPSAGRAAGNASEYRVRSTLVVLQIAISVTLVVAAGLLARTYVQLGRADLGFTTHDAITFRVAPPPTRYRSAQSRNAFELALLDALADLPHVRGAGGLSHLPFDSLPNWSTPYARLDAAPDAPARDADARTLTPGLLAALGARLVAGRDFTPADERGTTPVAIVDERLAERTWPGESVVGRQLRADPSASGTPDAVVQIVGVIRHLRHRTPAREVREQIYFPQRQVQRTPIAFVIAGGDPAQTAQHAKAAVARLDPALPVYDVRPLGDYLARARSVQRFTAWLAGAFSASALALAAVGIYGILSYSVVRRRREIAIRTAVGARRATIVNLVLGEAGVLGACGIALGGAGAAAIAALLRAQLYEVEPYDPWIFSGAALLLILCVVGAALAPALRAARAPALDGLRTP